MTLDGLLTLLTHVWPLGCWPWTGCDLPDLCLGQLSPGNFPERRGNEWNWTTTGPSWSPSSVLCVVWHFCIQMDDWPDRLLSALSTCMEMQCMKKPNPGEFLKCHFPESLFITEAACGSALIRWSCQSSLQTQQLACPPGIPHRGTGLRAFKVPKCLDAPVLNGFLKVSSWENKNRNLKLPNSERISKTSLRV